MRPRMQQVEAFGSMLELLSRARNCNKQNDLQACECPRGFDVELMAVALLKRTMATRKSKGLHTKLQVAGRTR